MKDVISGAQSLIGLGIVVTVATLVARGTYELVTAVWGLFG
jgi:hypothetical protein